MFLTPTTMTLLAICAHGLRVDLSLVAYILSLTFLSIKRYKGQFSNKRASYTFKVGANSVLYFSLSIISQMGRSLHPSISDARSFLNHF